MKLKELPSDQPYVLKNQYIYGLGQFECWLEGSDGYRMPVSYRTGVRLSDGSVNPITTTSDQLLALTRRFCDEYRGAYGKDWVFHVEHRGEEPHFVLGSRQIAEEIILAGPDTPGKRFLLGRQGSGLQDMNDLPGMENVKPDKDENSHWY